MDRHKAPRANRSKKTLPAAFCNREVRVQSPSPLGDGGEGTRPTAAAARGSSGPNSDTVADPQPPPQPPPVLGWAAGPGDLGERREAIRLETLVFLSSCPQRHGHFAMKKMLHPPTLELFCLVELPGADHQRAVLRASLQDWLRRWCALHAEHPDLLVAVCEAFWDAPHGYPVGILSEYMPLGSLDELIQACGGLPEEAMREIAQAMLQALSALHSAQPPVVHGCLKPSQVLFNAAGKPRLAFGLEQRLKGCQVWPASGPGVGGARGADDGSVRAGGDDGGASGSTSCEQSPAVDIFDLGLLLLVSALGGLDVLLDAIPYAREFGSQSSRCTSAPLSAVSHDTCGLLQRELQNAGAEDGGVTSQGAASDVGYLPPASDLLFNRRYSEPFLAFVSTCLEAHTQSEPVSARDLLQHEFLRSQACCRPLVTLREMQALARLLNEAPDHDPSRFGPAKSARSPVPGVAPSVAQSAQLYLMNIAQCIAPHSEWNTRSVPRGGGRPRSLSEGESVATPVRWRQQEWDTLLIDTARTLGLSRSVVQSALEAQLERLMQSTAR